jgi:phosphatidylserine/phosphatidylglycerophosphate/cardiolipin synthase-like enzyme
MNRDPWNGAVNDALNSPGKALVILLVMAAFGAGYYIGRNGVPAGLAPTNSSPAGESQDNISLHFSPNGGCTDAVVAEIRDAKQTILMQAYSFTSKGISSALIAAQQRGVKVTLIVDKKECNATGAKTADVAQAGASAYVDGKHAIAHNKIMLLDGRTIITGSFNFTNQAEHSNAENLLVLHDKPKLFQAYEQNFREHLAHSEAYSAMAENDSSERRRSNR